MDAVIRTLPETRLRQCYYGIRGVSNLRLWDGLLTYRRRLPLLILNSRVLLKRIGSKPWYRDACTSIPRSFSPS